MYPEYFTEALNSIKAPRWKILMARLFGHKAVEQDGPFQVTIHWWRGVGYVTDSRELQN